MTLTAQTKNLIRRLGRVAYLQDPAYLGPLPTNSIPAPSPPIQAGIVHRNVHTPEIDDSKKPPVIVKPEMGLVLTAEQAQLYHQVLEALIGENELEHLSRHEVRDALWAFYCDLAFNYASYRRNPRDARARITEFADRLVRSHDTFEVMFEVDFLLVTSPSYSMRLPVFVEGRSYDIETTFLTVDNTILNDWGVLVSDEAQPRFAWPSSGDVVGIVTLTAGSPKKAVERAEVALDSALDLMRAALLRIGPAHHVDLEFQQRRGEMRLVRKIGRPPLSSAWGQRDPSPLDLDDSTKQQIDEYLQPLNRLASSELSPELKAAFWRASAWIGASVTRDSLDDKVTDLCTALECILVPETDGRKGELIALRTLLLLGTDWDDEVRLQVGRLYQLYKRRSEIVHGADRGICDDHDVADLRRWTASVLCAALDVIHKNPSIRKRSDLVAHLQSEEDMQAVDEYLGTWPDTGGAIRTLREFASKLAVSTAVSHTTR